MDTTQKLYRSRTDRMVGGVLGGIAKRFGIDPTIVRLGYVALALLTAAFPALLLYILAMIIVPEEPLVTYEAAPAPPAEPPAPPVQPVEPPAPPVESPVEPPAAPGL